MSNNLGLYVRDDTEHLEKSGYPLSGNPPEENTWQRTGLYQNGKPITKTSVETNNRGLYFVADKDGYEIDPVTHTKHSVKGKLLLNGSNVANVDNGGKFGTHINSSGLSVGETQLSAPNSVINITLEDYNTLRGGTPVDGYARYNDEAVYNIVDDVEAANEEYKNNSIVFPTPDINLEGIYDIIYNSYVNDWEEYTVSNKTITDVNTPTLAIRHADPYGVAGEGIMIEYFVDTKYTDSLTKGVIGDKFTVYVRDSYGKVVYSHTTYAGHHRIVTAPFKDENGQNIVGRTWYSIQCVDDSHRSSCEWFFEVCFKQENYSPRIYDMQNTDLSLYGITPDSSDPIDAYKNRLGFARLINDIKNNPNYDGIRFYNANPNDDLQSSDNTSYYINIYSDIGVDGAGNNAVKHWDIDKDLTNNDYLSRDDADFEFAHQDYYIVYYNAGSSTETPKLDAIEIAPSGSTEFVSQSLIEEAQSDWSHLYDNPATTNLEAFKIEPGKTFKIGTRQVTVPQTCNTHEGILDWIWQDGAGICRENNDYQNGKIIRHDGGPSDYDNTEVRITNDALARRAKCLRVISINGDMKCQVAKYIADYTKQTKGYKTKNDTAKTPYDDETTFPHYPFKPGEGYYYASYSYGVRKKSTGEVCKYGEHELPILNDFTIDFNSTSWKLLDTLSVNAATDILPLNMCSNIDIKNGWIKGIYDGSEEEDAESYIITLLKRGYLAENMFTLAPWEGCGLISTVGSRFCNFENMRISGPLGYNCRVHGFGAHTFINVLNNDSNSVLPSITKHGYVNNSGDKVTNKTCILKDKDNNSLLSLSSYDYVSRQSTDICLATSEFIDLASVYIKGYDTHANRNHSHELLVNDEINIGDWNYRPNMKYPELFVHFYDVDNNYIRTVKTQVNRRVKKLRGASKIRITVYLTGTLNNDTPSLYLSNAINNRLSKLNVQGTGVSEGIVYKDCSFYMSKSCMIEQTAINMTLKNCDIISPIYAPKDIALENPYPIGSEEHAGLQMLFNVEDCIIKKVPFGANDAGGDDEEIIEEDSSNMRNKAHHQINFSRNGTFVNIIRSTGFTIHGNVTGLYIADSYMYTVSNSVSPIYMPNSYSCIKHSIVENVGSWSTITNIHSAGINWLNQLSGDKLAYYSACEEPVNVSMPIEETFLNKPLSTRKGRHIKGRLYHNGEFPFDIYTSMTYERLNRLWESRHDYANPANNEGWVHFICYVLPSHSRFGIGLTETKNYLQKTSNGKIAVMLDGNPIECDWVKIADKDYGEVRGIAIPELGYHVVSYKLLPIHLPSSRGAILVPEGVLFTELPRYISYTSSSDNFKFSDIFKATNGTNSYLNFFGKVNPITPLIYNADEYVDIGGSIGGGTVIDMYITNAIGPQPTSGKWTMVNGIRDKSFNLETLI